MLIKALEFYVNGEMKQSFAMGGTMNKEEIDVNKTYPSSLQNYLIDTGNEIILVDTGLPIETPDFEKKPNQQIYTGEKKYNFIESLNNLGYTPEDIDIIILTHKHPDHSGELRKFKNAKIYISRIEADIMGIQGDNIIKVDFTSGSYYNFNSSQKIVEGVYMIPAYGHTKGNSIAIVEKEDIFYMIHGDVTYTDKALIKSHLSVVFEDKEAAKKTLEEVRNFIKNNKTIYLSTHTPEGIVSLKENKIFSLVE